MSTLTKTGPGERGEKFPILAPCVVTASFLWDVMTTMVESSYDWFTFRNVARRPDTDADEHEDDPLSVTGFTVFEVEEDAETLADAPRWQIGPAEVIAAMAQIAGNPLSTSPGNRACILSALAEDDAGQIDSDAADCILQIATFGELRYG